MSKIYGIGAAIVILGALFKINHYPFANEMLIVGLTTEAIIFIFSAFEPPYIEPDWSLVYPELAGMYHGTAVEDELEKRKTATERLDDMFKDAGVDKDLINRLGEGIKKFSENASQMSDIADASVATNEYVDNIRQATSTVGELADSYKNASDMLKQDADASVDYIENIKSASESASVLATAYARAAEVIAKDMATTEKFADNLAALNSVYELQMQSTNQMAEANTKIQDAMLEFIGKLDTTTANTTAFGDQMKELSDRMASLSQVYGNMLSAMTVNKA